MRCDAASTRDSRSSKAFFFSTVSTDDKRIFDDNYQATMESIARALRGEPSLKTVLDSSEAARHPFAGGSEG